jgi:uncharacterized membrane protein
MESFHMNDKQTLEEYERAHDPVRVLTLTDGVFAIILTLLVLELHVPDLTAGQSLREAMREIRPSFIAFLITFVIVAIAWAGHRDLFSLIRLTDRNLVWLNFLYLLPLSILPFGASLISRYDDQAIALRLYGAMLLAGGLTRLFIWWYATGRPYLLHQQVDKRTRLASATAVSIPMVAYLIAILVAKSHPTISLAIFAGGPVLYFLSITLARSTAPPGSLEEDFT